MIMATAMSVSSNAAGPVYPIAPQDTTVIDKYFNLEVRDIYRPLEDDNSAGTKAWVDAENRLTRSYLDTIQMREVLKNRLSELNNYPKHGMPWLGNDGMYYFFENEGLKNQALLYRTSKLGDTAELFLDPNALSEDGTVALTGVEISPDGKYTAYTISRSGSDWTEIYLMDTKTKQLLPDHIQWAKFTGAEWDNESKGFYYSAYPLPEKGKEFSNANKNHSVYYHKIGTPQEKDVLVFSNPQEPMRFHTTWVAQGTPWIFVMGSGQGLGNSIMMKNLKQKGADWIEIEPSQNYGMSPIAVIDNKLYLHTTYNAPTGKLIAIDLNAPDRQNWKDVIPAGDAVLGLVSRAGKNRLVAVMQKDASSHAYIYDLKGNRHQEIQLPGYGTLSVSSTKKSPEMFYSYSSFNTPATIYSYNVDNGNESLYKETELKGFNPDDYTVEQVFYTSKDGTKIPMFLTYRKDLKRDGSNPVYLYGYGGFNISLTPTFTPNRLVWLENGGIYAQANLRGGSEYGEEWHEAGTKLNKLNVFNDFISAAEYMIEQGWTTPDNIVIEGGSNGGLLVGATVNMRPDLFRVAIPRVGVMDMMRYHLFTIGWNWAPDYGRSDDSPEMAEYLYGYSPLHNIKNDGTPYPAILVTTADHDDRVVPAHSFKYAAQLQQSNTGDAPKLIRIDSKAGHGAGKPISKIIDEWADIYSFIFNNLKKK